MGRLNQTPEVSTKPLKNSLPPSALKTHPLSALKEVPTHPLPLKLTLSALKAKDFKRGRPPPVFTDPT